MKQIIKQELYSTAYFPQAEQLNPQIIDAFQQLVDDESTRKTHLFEGRYENIYIDADKIPAIQPVLGFLTNTAADILGVYAAELACGFWFNSMPPGHRTLNHTHDDDDELLSAVYYLVVPANSGNLFLGQQGQQLEVQSETGKAVFFSPALPHEVSENKSSELRLSIGMNFGIHSD